LLSKKILVVEDNHDIRALLEIVLTSWGWDAVLAKTGGEALVKLKTQTPRVILLDMRLPDMSGLELAAILKSHPFYGHIPILATTALHHDYARKRCLAAGCDDFISKPFAIPALQSSLANLTSLERQKTIAATAYESAM
jgi:CheY-like chemotaxis protein